MRWVKSLISVSSVYIVYMNMSCTLNFLLLLVVHFTSYRFPFRKLNYRIKQFQYLFRFLSSNTISPTRSRTCQHHTEITQSHTFAALIRLSTTTHNLLTFNTSEISSNNSYNAEKLSLLANKHLWTFLLLSSYSSCRM